ncbi:MAG: ribosome maturation factor RimP [Actinobacteria bacterium]|nr:ribosome maturation factor RimP [Actinomycetota bacterium]
MRALVTPSLEAVGVEVVDVELAANVLRVTIDRPGGVDLDLITDTSRRISADLDRDEQDPDRSTPQSWLPSRYVLEVSSPGLERPLRRPEHFKRVVGSTVALKTRPDTAGERRVEGILEAADDEGVVVAGHTIPYSAIEKARTRFVWPQPQPKHPSRPRASSSRSLPDREEGTG